jgi:aspartyl-tRNA(Asn)/glutamyl-tRNA(Gln) amidotransferase subunit C
VAITEADVRHIAALARVGIATDRVPALVRELNGILGHMDALQSVEVPETLGERTVDAGMPLRADVVDPVALERAREDFAPQMREGFFLVPRLDTHGTAASTDEGES